MTVCVLMEAKASTVTSPQCRRMNRQLGLTMVELLVALALSSVIAVAAVASLIVARQGFTSVDATSQLRDNGRFAADLIQRLAVQGGFHDVNFAAATKDSQFAVAPPAVNPGPNVIGLDNALLPTGSTTSDLSTFISRPSATATQSGCASSTDTACANGSDVLILRYQSSEGIIGSGVADGSMINCAGNAETAAPIDKNDRIVSVFHVARSTAGEPSLMCSYQNSAGGWETEPVVEGVESFQVSYGVDGVNSAINTKFSGAQDTVPDRYLRASQMVVGTDAESADTYSNWQRVRSLRVGLVLRGPANSAVSKSTTIAKLCALGFNPDVPTDCVDKSGTESPSMGSEFPRNGASLADDGRLRQVLTFTVFLRNIQTQ